MKKILRNLLVVMVMLTGVIGVFGSSAHAATTYGGVGACANGFLGFVPWDCNVSKITNEDSLKNGVWQIAANVATDIAVAATYLVLGYVIYGGYLYIFSDGDPGKTAAAKKTLSQAFIGLAITMSANLIMSTIRFAIFGANGAFTDKCLSGGGCVSAPDLVNNMVNWFIGVAGAVALIFMVYGGIMYMTSNGDPNKTQKAKNMIMYAVIGLIIVGLSTVITGFVTRMIKNAQSANLDNTTIAKEVYEKNIN